EAGSPDLTRAGRLRECFCEAARADRLPARQRRGPQCSRARLGRSARTVPRHARRTDASRVREAALPRSQRRAAAVRRRHVEDDRACDNRSERRLPGAREPNSRPVPGQARAGPGVRARSEPDTDRRACMKRLLLASFLRALAVPGQASAARFAIGIQRGADEQSVARRVQAVTGQPVTKIGAFALSVRARHAGGLASVKGTSWVERMRPTRRLSFTPNDPLGNRQWYLGRIHAFDAWTQLPTLETVRVAVLDSGVDSGHPDLQSQIADGRSFVSSSWESDTNGHGTFVAGEIAAATNNGTGIAAVGFPVELL